MIVIVIVLVVTTIGAIVVKGVVKKVVSWVNSDSRLLASRYRDQGLLTSSELWGECFRFVELINLHLSFS